MKTLKVIDSKNYTPDMPVFEKFAVRAVIIKDGRMAMQKAGTGYYKILGGGVEKDETYPEALAREVEEESGLLIERGSIREIGEIVERREDLFEKGTTYICHSIFFYCDIIEATGQVALTESEIREDFKLEWASLEDIIAANHRVIDKPWVDRDTIFIEMLRDGLV